MNEKPNDSVDPGTDNVLLFFLPLCVHPVVHCEIRVFLYLGLTGSLSVDFIYTRVVVLFHLVFLRTLQYVCVCARARVCVCVRCVYSSFLKL